MSASFTEVSQRLTGIGRAMAQDFFPWLKKALDVISAFLDFARAHMPATEAAFAGLGLALGALSAMKFVGLVSQIAGVTGGLGASMTAAMGLLGVLGRLGLIGAAGAVGYGVGSLLSSGIDAGLSALNGAPSALGSSVYDAFHPGESARATAPTGTPRGIRNNNPGNLNFAGQRGASKESGPGGRFATFQSMPEGIAALADQLQLYASRGTDSVRAIISKYAPSGENNTEAYIKTIMSKLGVSADQHLNMADPNTLRTLIDGISGVENGRGKISLDQINAGMSLAQSRRAGGGSVSNRNSSEIHIGAMTVNTKATDAAGIARDIGPAMKNQAYALNADYGLN
jgi:hypothetical protein